MDPNQIAIKVDNVFHTLNKALNPNYSGLAYGRGLEQASGLGMWFISFTLLYSGYYGVGSETLSIDNFFLAWLTGIIGLCQIYYNGKVQRMVFTLLGSAAWLTIALGAFQIYGDFNMVTAASIPYCLSTFYVFGFLCGQPEDVKE